MQLLLDSLHSYVLLFDSFEFMVVVQLQGSAGVCLALLDWRFHFRGLIVQYNRADFIVKVAFFLIPVSWSASFTTLPFWFDVVALFWQWNLNVSRRQLLAFTIRPSFCFPSFRVSFLKLIVPPIWGILIFYIIIVWWTLQSALLRSCLSRPFFLPYIVVLLAVIICIHFRWCRVLVRISLIAWLRAEIFKDF